MLTDQHKPYRELSGFQSQRRQALKLAASAGLTAVAAPCLLDRPVWAKNQNPGGQVIIGFSQEPTVFNPHLMHIEVDDGIHFALFDPLFNTDTAGNFYPVLAREVPTVENGGVSADGLQWRIKLRDDVRWHDGRLFTADDVKFTLDLLVDKNFRSWRTTGHEHVRDLKVVSPTELTWRMAKPFAPYFSILALTFIIPKHAFEGVADKNNAPFNHAPIGTGAFKFKRRVAGDYLELEANRDYVGEGPYLERIIYKYIPDLTMLYTQFKAGEIDVTGLQGITADHYEDAKALPGKHIEVAYISAVECLGLNLSRPWFKERAVREAIYYALDKDAIINTIYYGLPTPVESYLPTEFTYYNPDLPAHEYNLDKARALLNAAGWKPGVGGVREKNDVRLSFRHSTTAGDHLREQAQQFLQQSLRQVGIDIIIHNLPPAVMWGDFWMMSQFDAIFVGATFVAGADPDASDYFHSSSIAAKGGNGRNGWVYENPQLDELFAEGGRTFDAEKRRVLYQQAQATIRRDLPMLPIFQYASVHGYRQGLQGFAPNINNRIETWNVNQWRWV